MKTHSFSMAWLAKTTLVASLAAGSTACTYASVGAGEVAVVRTPAGVVQRVFPTGDWQIGVGDSATKYSIRSQESHELLEVLASNGLRIVLDASIRYHVIPSEAVALDQEFGQSYYSVLIGPTLSSQARRVVGRFQPEEIYSTQREQIEREVGEGVGAAMKGRHVALEAVLIRNVRLPDSIQMAINNKLEAEQQALKMKYVIAEAEAQQQKKLMEAKSEVERARLQVEGEAESGRVRAQGEADAKRLGAQADADAKQLDAKATADYERQVQAYLTPQILRLREIDASKALGESPSSKFVLLGGGGGANTVLNLHGLLGGASGGKADGAYP